MVVYYYYIFYIIFQELIFKMKLKKQWLNNYTTPQRKRTACRPFLV